VSENLVTALAELLVTPMLSEIETAQQRCYVTYHHAALPQDLPLSPTTTLLESRALISASGTTGLRTWEAALHLGQYLCTKPNLIKSKRILELGAGTGYLSILCANHLAAAHVIASDGSDDVVNNLPDNIFVNDLQGHEDRITVMELKWGHALVGTEEKTWNGGRPIDVVLGADVIFDIRIIPALVATLDDLAVMFPQVEILISATERNVDTLKSFHTAADKAGFVVQPLRFPIPATEKQFGPFYSDQVPIHIMRLIKSRSQ